MNYIKKASFVTSLICILAVSMHAQGSQKSTSRMSGSQLIENFQGEPGIPIFDVIDKDGEITSLVSKANIESSGVQLSSTQVRGVLRYMPGGSCAAT